MEYKKECFLFQNWEFVDIGCHGNDSIVPFSPMRNNSQRAFYEVSMTENRMEIFLLNQKLWRFLRNWGKHSIFAYLCKLDANISLYAQYRAYLIFSGFHTYLTSSESISGTAWNILINYTSFKSIFQCLKLLIPPRRPLFPWLSTNGKNCIFQHSSPLFCLRSFFYHTE